MSSLLFAIRRRQVAATIAMGIVCLNSAFVFADDGAPAAAAGRSILAVPDADAASPAEMKPYKELVEHADAAKIDMLPIPAGEFLMGSPESEPGRSADEGPPHRVKIEPFWMSKCEIPWDVYENWMFDLDIKRREVSGASPTDRDAAALEYQTSQPTAPYTDMTFGMGKKGFPAICMTQLSARVFCQWLTAKTGRYYRLPTEAEWEYACRAGTTTAYSFGDDPTDLDEYAVYFDNSNEKYGKIGKKKPNKWGLCDMHGNVAEWVLDEYRDGFYAATLAAAGGADNTAGAAAVSENPLAIPEVLYPRVVRGGSWNDDPDKLRSAARTASTDQWSRQDPQIPKSIWYHTDALHVGFRVVRPLVEPSEEEKAARWDKTAPFQDRKSGR
jgi:formylglycine-generating enzyme required for sulfatase activity